MGWGFGGGGWGWGGGKEWGKYLLTRFLLPVVQVRADFVSSEIQVESAQQYWLLAPFTCY